MITQNTITNKYKSDYSILRVIVLSLDEYKKEWSDPIYNLSDNKDIYQFKHEKANRIYLISTVYWWLNEFEQELELNIHDFIEEQSKYFPIIPGEYLLQYKINWYWDYSFANSYEPPSLEYGIEYIGVLHSRAIDN